MPGALQRIIAQALLSPADRPLSCILANILLCPADIMLPAVPCRSQRIPCWLALQTLRSALQGTFR